MTIVRTKTKATGGITDAEKVLMGEHAKLWISRAFRTDPIEPDKIIPAIEGLYAAAGLEKPHVVIVPSPMVMAFAFGASAAIWHTVNALDTTTRNATRNATDGATAIAILNATDFTTRNATHNAARNTIRNATDGATDGATAIASAIVIATRNATDNDTRNATDGTTATAVGGAIAIATRNTTYDDTRKSLDTTTRNATSDALDSTTRNVTAIAAHSAAITRNAIASATLDNEGIEAQACYELGGKLGLTCAAQWSRVYQGGNMWVGDSAYLTAYRDILGLELPCYKDYAYWEQAAIHGGFRVMHEKFCIVSDFPEIIKIDNQNMPHCEDGPSHRWRDGWSLYHWHGTSIPQEWIENPETLTAEKALTWENVDQRSAACEILGWHNIIAALDVTVIDEDDDPQIGRLIEVQLPDHGPQRFIHATCGTGREIAIMADINAKTIIEAQAASYGLSASDFTIPEIRT